MPQLLILAAVGAGAYFGLKWVSKKARKFTADMEQVKKEVRRQRESNQRHVDTSRQKAEELKKDPKTGIYYLDDD